MMSSMKQPDATRSTRDRILDATIDLLGEVGWTGLNLRLIADRAEANGALIHYYFGSKAELLLTATRQAMERDVGNPTLAFRREETVAGGIRRMGRAVARLDRNSTHVGLIGDAYAQGTRDPELAKVLNDIWQTRNQELREVLLEKGTLGPDVDVDALIVTIFTFFSGLLQYKLLLPKLDVRPAVELVASLVDGLETPLKG